jgi:hypothetical protein
MTYQESLKLSPKTVAKQIKKDSKEVIFGTVSCMCDNKHTLRFKKNESGEFRLSSGRFSLSNWQMKHDYYELTWAADEQNWEEVIRMINTGTENVYEVRSR